MQIIGCFYHTMLRLHRQEQHGNSLHICGYVRAAALKPAWGFHPQTPSSLRAGLKQPNTNNAFRFRERRWMIDWLPGCASPAVLERPLREQNGFRTAMFFYRPGKVPERPLRVRHPLKQARSVTRSSGTLAPTARTERFQNRHVLLSPRQGAGAPFARAAPFEASAKRSPVQRDAG